MNKTISVLIWHSLIKKRIYFWFSDKKDSHVNSDSKNTHSWIEEILQIPEIIDLDRKSYFQSNLFIVPTPLGNLRDLSLRAFDALNEAEVIICEDTRITGKLFKMME